MPRAARFDEVLDGASRLFAKFGFAATSVRQVAEGADLTKAGLYYHIREKEDLLAVICEHAITSIVEAARSAVAGAPDALAGLRAIIDVHLRFFYQHPHDLVVLNREMGQLSPARRKGVADLERQYLDLVRGVIREGQRTGSLKKQDPTVAAFLLLSMLNGLDAWYDPKGRVGRKALARQLIEIFLRGAANPQLPRSKNP